MLREEKKKLNDVSRIVEFTVEKRRVFVTFFFLVTLVEHRSGIHPRFHHRVQQRSLGLFLCQFFFFYNLFSSSFLFFLFFFFTILPLRHPDPLSVTTQSTTDAPPPPPPPPLVSSKLFQTTRFPFRSIDQPMDSVLPLVAK